MEELQADDRAADFLKKIDLLIDGDISGNWMMEKASEGLPISEYGFLQISTGIMFLNMVQRKERQRFFIMA